jgi:hypothetical protein
VYGTVDGVTHLVKKKREPSDSYRIVDGYSDLRLYQQQPPFEQTSPKRSPWKIGLLKKVLSKQNRPERESTDTSSSWAPTKPIPSTTRTDTTSSLSKSYLDRFKGTVYGVSDVIGNGIQMVLSHTNGQRQSPTVIPNTMLMRTIPPVVQSRRTTTTTTTSGAIGQDTDPSKASSSPSFDQWKETIYAISDTISATGQQVAQLPSDLQKASQQTQQWLEQTESDLQNTVQTISELPATIQQIRKDLVQTTFRWIAIARNAPIQMQKSILDTVEQIRSIPQTMRSNWIHTLTTVRIWFRLKESPQQQPHPPMLEPPETAFRGSTAIATSSTTPFRDLTWALIQFSARGMWWSMTQLPVLTWNGWIQIRTALLQPKSRKAKQSSNPLYPYRSQRQ